jgi:hypothetical protein
MARVANEEARPRQAVLSLANETELGKCMVNSGRLSVSRTGTTGIGLSRNSHSIMRA